VLPCRNTKKKLIWQKCFLLKCKYWITPHYHTTGFAHPQLPVLKIEEPHIVQPLSWGLIPGWVKSEADAIETANKTLNARVETIFTTPMFRNYTNNRCLIFVEGFFEWKHVGKEKVPHFIYMPGHIPFALGGIHTTWHNPKLNQVISGCSLITTDADELMATIHNSKKECLWFYQKESGGNGLIRALRNGISKN
jgi:putative SOS response-associated peptidase YedK